MYTAQHADACYKKFGKQYYEIHEFLDRYQKEYQGFGIAHRRLLHHRLGLDLIVREFKDEKYRDPAELHIRQDLNGQLPEDWTFFDDCDDVKSLPRDQYERQNDELIKLYGIEDFMPLVLDR